MCCGATDAHRAARQRSVNETWIADRDRFSYRASTATIVCSADSRQRRLAGNRLGDGARGVAERLGRVAKQHGGAQLGAIASPNSTLEELYLLARIARGLGSANLDHRLRRADFRDQASDPLYPGSAARSPSWNRLNCRAARRRNIRKEVPLIAHRIRKAARAAAQGRLHEPAALRVFVPGRGVPLVQWARQVRASRLRSPPRPSPPPARVRRLRSRR